MTARFPVGTEVRVGRAFPPGHVRTPFFVRGKTGVVSGVVGKYPNPEELAYGRDGLPERPLYRVTFRQSELWPDYQGSDQDTTVVDIYEHWLVAADGRELAADKREHEHV